MSKFTAKKRLLSKKLVTAYDPLNYEYCESFNQLSMNLIKKNKDIKYLIVGTLTPPEGRKNGYFYTASKNKMFRYIDLSFSDSDGLYLEKQKNNRADIEKILRERHVAFIDVINEAIVLKGSSRDDDILSYTLDYKSFEEIFSMNPNIKIAVNSKNAETAFIQICNVLNFKSIKYKFIPQNIRGHHDIYKNEDCLINERKSFFKN